MRPAASPFAGFSSEPKKTSWDELSRERDTDGETKNYSVPPELIELARANRKGRGQVGTLTPLAPKPLQDVVVVVPVASPLALGIEPEGLADPESALQAPSVPIALEGSSHDPESARTAIQGKGNIEPARAALPEPSASAAALHGESAPVAESSADSRDSTSARRSSRRGRRSLRIELPVEAAAAARAATNAPASRSQTYRACVAGALLVGAYIVLCYYANAILAGLP